MTVLGAKDLPAMDSNGMYCFVHSHGLHAVGQVLVIHIVNLDSVHKDTKQK